MTAYRIAELEETIKKGEEMAVSESEKLRSIIKKLEAEKKIELDVHSVFLY